MHIIIKTYVEQDLKTVFEGFDRELFLKLKPPGIGLKLLRFDGCEKGSIVQLELNFGLFKQGWTSEVTDMQTSDEEISFIDESEGKNLPFFLKKWKHTHRLLRQGDGTIIIDDIQYQSPLGLNLLFYPAIWMQMAWRKPIYKKLFRQNTGKRN